MEYSLVDQCPVGGLKIPSNNTWTGNFFLKGFSSLVKPLQHISDPIQISLNIRYELIFTYLPCQETREERIRQYHEIPGTPPVLGLREGALLKVDDNSATVLRNSARVFYPYV